MVKKAVLFDIDIELILKSVPGYVFWKDVNSVYLGCNKNAALLAGLKSPEDAIGKTDYDLPWGKLKLETVKSNIEADKYVIKTGKSITTEENLGIKNTNGISVVVMSQKMPLYNKDGKIIGIVGISIDITAEKEAERLRTEVEKHHAVEEEQEYFKEFIGQLLHIINNYKIFHLNNKLGQSQSKSLDIKIKLSKREKEILYYLSLNKAPKEIAQILSIIHAKNISFKTVQSVISSQLYSKFDAFSIGQLVETAHAYKLIPFIL